MNGVTKVRGALTAVALAALLALGATGAGAQGLLNKLKEKAKPKAETNGAHAEGFRLDQNPGEYEVKVLRGGKLARAFKFTVGADGRIADNRIASASRLDTYRILVPAQVLGTDDGQWDREAWKAGAFYGNPLTSFTPGN